MITMIKTFQNTNLSSLEDSINEFLMNHKDDPTYQGAPPRKPGNSLPR